MGKIRILYKEPGKAAQWREVVGDLLSMQNIVGGRVKQITVFTDMVILCNENAQRMQLPYNGAVCGASFFGTILFVGIKGGRFADCPVLPGFPGMEVE